MSSKGHEERTQGKGSTEEKWHLEKYLRTGEGFSPPTPHTPPAPLTSSPKLPQLDMMFLALPWGQSALAPAHLRLPESRPLLPSDPDMWLAPPRHASHFQSGRGSSEPRWAEAPEAEKEEGEILAEPGTVCRRPTLYLQGSLWGHQVFENRCKPVKCIVCKIRFMVYKYILTMNVYIITIIFIQVCNYS